MAIRVDWKSGHIINSFCRKLFSSCKHRSMSNLFHLRNDFPGQQAFTHKSRLPTMEIYWGNCALKL